MVYERLEAILWRVEPKVRGKIVWMSDEPVTKEDFGFSADRMTPKGIYGNYAVNIEIEGGAVMGRGDMWTDSIPPKVVRSLNLKEGMRVEIGFLTGRVAVLEKINLQ